MPKKPLPKESKKAPKEKKSGEITDSNKVGYSKARTYDLKGGKATLWVNHKTQHVVMDIMADGEDHTWTTVSFSHDAKNLSGRMVALMEVFNKNAKVLSNLAIRRDDEDSKLKAERKKLKAKKKLKAREDETKLTKAERMLMARKARLKKARRHADH